MYRVEAYLVPDAPAAPPKLLGRVEIWSSGEGFAIAGTRPCGAYAAHVKDARGLVAGKRESVGLVPKTGNGPWDILAKALRALGFNALRSSPEPQLDAFARAAEAMRAAVNDLKNVHALRDACARYDEAREGLNEWL